MTVIDPAEVLAGVSPASRRRDQEGNRVMDTELLQAAENAAETAEFYRNYAARYEVGSLGYIANLAEAEKYGEMAGRWKRLAGRAA